jgi:organic radical activating enzyme
MNKDLEFKKQYLDTKSASFCAAKWYNATIWLGSGQTTSCHHPLPHQIDLEEIKTNPKAIHNTKQKKLEREQMQKGERPTGCEYCWKIEDIGPDNVSDRVYKSKIYSNESLDTAYNTPCQADVDLQTLEISFDRTCNFACSYCNPAFSTTWVKDIKNNGPYINLQSDGRNHFTHTHDASQKYGYGEFNPYVDAFWRWWESDLHKTLKELRVTGGEPLMSADMWKLLDWFKNNHSKSETRLSINSNLCPKDELMDKLIDASHHIKHFDVYTSAEAMWSQAEYIRDGMNFKQWHTNMLRLLEHGSLDGLHVMCTINALSLDSLPELIDMIVAWKRSYGKDYPNFTLNILRFPSFQSPVVLPQDIKDIAIKKLKFQTDIYKDDLHDMEINQMNRLIHYLESVDSPHSGADTMDKLQHDFKNFYKQYDQRRQKNFDSTFSKEMVEWYGKL